MLRIAGEWGNSRVTLDRLLLENGTKQEVRAARVWSEGCYRAFIQVKHLHDFGTLVNPGAPEFQVRPS